MTASTPPLVEVIAAALAGHWAFSAHTEPFVDRCDGCGEVVHTNGTQLKHALAAHQARALLDAISEAGAVEWATEHVAQGSRTIEIHPCDSEADAQGAITYYGHNCLVVTLSNETCEEERMRLGPDIERTTVTYTAKWEAKVEHRMVSKTYGHDYCTGCKKERPDL